MRYVSGTILRRSVVAGILSLAVFAAPAAFGPSQIASARTLHTDFQITAGCPSGSTAIVRVDPQSQTVRPSYGDAASVTVTYNQSANCLNNLSLAVGWGDGQSSTSNQLCGSCASSTNYSYNPSHIYAASSGTNNHYLTVWVKSNGVIVATITNAASVTVIGCPPTCLPSHM